MTDEEVAKGYMAVTSAGIDRPGTIAAKLKADHLAARARVAELERAIYDNCPKWLWDSVRQP